MKQSRTKIADTIAQEVLESGMSGDYAKQVAAYLLAERRVDDVDSILRDISLSWAKAGHVEVLAYSAHELSKAIISDITQEVSRYIPDAKHIKVTPVIEPGVVGGVRLEFMNKQLDLSVDAKLRKFKQLTTTGKD